MPDYYHSHFREYYNRTFSIDPSDFLNPFIKKFALGSHILDIGCGSGRDILWLKNKGFKVTGFERSSGLADLARKNSGCEVIEGDFETFDFSRLSADAILASGSLVHTPHNRLQDVIKNISQVLSVAQVQRSHDTTFQYKSNLLYLSLKQGSGSKTDNKGRVFYFWTDKELRNLFNKIGFAVSNFLQSRSAAGTGEVWLGYVLETEKQRNEKT